MRKIKATFEIEDCSDLSCVTFECDDKVVEWNDLERSEQVSMLNAWYEHHNLFSGFLNND
jgi:hypothetical protein